MSQGKYSPTVNYRNTKTVDYNKNCYGQMPATWNDEVKAQGLDYDSKTMFADYDDEGFDSYGYSAFDNNGKFVGHGRGVDRNGYTEMDYLCMDADSFNDLV